MFENQLTGRSITNSRVLEAMERVPRHEFVPEEQQSEAYADKPLPIGEGQTISQPYMVAYMSERLNPKPSDRILDVGTGSGYQAAVLAELVAEVYTIEVVPALADRAAQTLFRLGYTNVHSATGDGTKGWPEHAPFDGILVAAASVNIPDSLIQQLRAGGKLILPVGAPGGVQTLTEITKSADGSVQSEKLLPVRFVPITRR